ncbi:MAG: VOC family protein [Deltaproteobacteria bacterium]|nr:VOC family protein [Deltaproteobacteria bacterium]
MKFHSSVIFVRDIEVSKDFYVGLLHQQVEHDFGKNVILKSGLSLWEIRPEHIISKKLETAASSNRFELYFETDLILEAFQNLKNAGVRFLHEIHEEPWGQRTMRFFDPDNHLVEIGEPLETFVLNMNDRGLSSEQIAAKSGIPLDTVNEILKSNLH